MNLYQLRYFAELAKNGHFRQTAEKLCIAQPSLSHAISLLERELGVVLFEKKGRRSVLTPEGAQFLEYVERGLGTLGIDLGDGVTMIHLPGDVLPGNGGCITFHGVLHTNLLV